MLLRTKVSAPVESIIMPVRPAKKAVVQALASETPDGTALMPLVSASRKPRAPIVEGEL